MSTLVFHGGRWDGITRIDIQCIPRALGEYHLTGDLTTMGHHIATLDGKPPRKPKTVWGEPTFSFHKPQDGVFERAGYRAAQPHRDNPVCIGDDERTITVKTSRGNDKKLPLISTPEERIVAEYGLPVDKYGCVDPKLVAAAERKRKAVAKRKHEEFRERMDDEQRAAASELKKMLKEMGDIPHPCHPREPLADAVYLGYGLPRVIGCDNLEELVGVQAALPDNLLDRRTKDMNWRMK